MDPNDRRFDSDCIVVRWVLAWNRISAFGLPVSSIGRKKGASFPQAGEA